MKFMLLPGEVEIDTWSLLYIPPAGGKFNGKLTVTNQRLLYDAKYDATITGTLANALVARWGSEGYLQIEKKDIRSIAVQKKLLSKKCILTLNDGSLHIFDYGAMNIDKTVAAIEAR